MRTLGYYRRRKNREPAVAVEISLSELAVIREGLTWLRPSSSCPIEDIARALSTLRSMADDLEALQRSGRES